MKFCSKFFDGALESVRNVCVLSATLEETAAKRDAATMLFARVWKMRLINIFKEAVS